MWILLSSSSRIPVHFRFLILVRSTYFPQHTILSGPQNMLP